MPTPVNPSTPQPVGGAHSAQPGPSASLDPHFGDSLRVFWERNSKVVGIVLVVVLLGIIGKGVWEYLQQQREQEIGRAYAAATGTLQLKAFAASHAGHPLAAAALLRVADEAYGEGKYGEAIPPYEQAASILKDGPLAGRARLGAAMAKFQGGRPGEGEAALKALAADATQLKPYRAEAAYHLATDAFANKNLAAAKTYVDQVLQIDPASPWAQRVLAIRAQLPATDAPISVPGLPTK